MGKKVKYIKILYHPPLFRKTKHNYYFSNTLHFLQEFYLFSNEIIDCINVNTLSFCISTLL